MTHKLAEAVGIVAVMAVAADRDAPDTHQYSTGHCYTLHNKTSIISLDCTYIVIIL